MLDISPEVNWLHSARPRNIGWEKALAELIDNAFDARANQVRITSVARTIVVSDDGSGVRDLSATVRSGRHVPTDSTELGMFGVGLKDAWHWAGHRMEVDTVHAGVRGVLIADSREMLKSSRWEIDDPVYTECHGAPTGTSITLHLANTAPRRNAPSEHKRGDNQHTKEDASIDAPSESEAAKLLNVSRANVQRAKAATKHCSKEVNAAIEDRTLTLNMATNLAKSIPDKREQTKVLKQGKEAVKQAITQAKSSEPAHKPALPKQINNDDSDECYDYQVVQSFPHWDYRLNTLRRIIGMLSKSEQLVVAEWLAN